MEPSAVFHRLVQRDMGGVLRYYREEASEAVADRFFGTFLDTLGNAVLNPKQFHPISGGLRRANIPRLSLSFIVRGDTFRYPRPCASS